MGFSFAGFIIAAVMLLPNLLLLLMPPKNKPTKIKAAGLLCSICENIGRIGCLVVLVIFPESFSNQPINVWLILGIVGIAFYYLLWLRYLRNGCFYIDLFKSFYFIPMPMAIAPVFVFICLSAWGMSSWLFLFAILFALGHLINSWQRYRYTRQL